MVSSRAHSQRIHLQQQILRAVHDRYMCDVYFPDRAVPPSFTKSLKKVDGCVGSNATLVCRVAGSQPMVISWFKDDKQIHNDHKYCLDFNESTASVVIAGLQQNDGGVYTCRASNDAGDKETSGTLFVKGQTTWILYNQVDIETNHRYVDMFILV